jgi:hypothetical protein
MKGLGHATTAVKQGRYLVKRNLAHGLCIKGVDPPLLVHLVSIRIKRKAESALNIWTSCPGDRSTSNFRSRDSKLSRVLSVLLALFVAYCVQACRHQLSPGVLACDVRGLIHASSFQNLNLMDALLTEANFYLSSLIDPSSASYHTTLSPASLSFSSSPLSSSSSKLETPLLGIPSFEYIRHLFKSELSHQYGSYIDFPFSGLTCLVSTAKI